MAGSTACFGVDGVPDDPPAIGSLGELPDAIVAQIGHEELPLGRVERVDHNLVRMCALLSHEIPAQLSSLERKRECAQLTGARVRWPRTDRHRRQGARVLMIHPPHRPSMRRQ